MWTHPIHPQRCCDIWAAGQYITLPTHFASHSVLRATNGILQYSWVCGSGKDCGPLNPSTTVIPTLSPPHRFLKETPLGRFSSISNTTAQYMASLCYFGCHLHGPRIHALKKGLPLFARDFHIIFVTTNPQKLNSMHIRIHSGLWCHPGKEWHAINCKACSILTSVGLITSPT